MDNIKIKYIGHSTFLITTKSGKKIIIDPWLKDNPSCSEDVNSIGEIDYILITHGHFDHVGDTLDIIKNNNHNINPPQSAPAKKYLKQLSYPGSLTII